MATSANGRFHDGRGAAQQPHRASHLLQVAGVQRRSSGTSGPNAPQPSRAEGLRDSFQIQEGQVTPVCESSASSLQAVLQLLPFGQQDDVWQYRCRVLDLLHSLCVRRIGAEVASVQSPTGFALMARNARVIFQAAWAGLRRGDRLDVSQVAYCRLHVGKCRQAAMVLKHRLLL